MAEEQIQLCNKVIQQKYNQSVNISRMNSCSVANEVMTYIIRQGKDALHDHYLRKEKVPIYANRDSESQSQQVVIHGGYQGQKFKKHSHFSLRNDQIPTNISKDNIAIKSNQVTRRHNSLIKSPITLKSSHYKSYSSKKKNRENNQNVGNKILNGFGEDILRQRQNQFIKLQQDKGNRIVVEKAKLRDELQQDVMREKKRQILLRQYQQKLSNQAFQKDREEKQAQKQKILQQHLKKGSSHSFNFDNDGELMLFQSPNPNKSHYPPQATFKIEAQQIDQDEIPLAHPNNRFERHRSSDFNKKNEEQQKRQNKQFYENQRIRSARGEAFASSVLRTVNLSKISMNGSLGEIDAEQFMKRNDLFNNNHTRQTTSIPYMQAKSGTVYTQITNNQAVRSIKPPSSTTAHLCKQDAEEDFKITSHKDRAQGQRYGNNQRKYSKTARVRVKQIQGKDSTGQITGRVIKSAQEDRGISLPMQRRPHTSINRGRITTANQLLVQTLLQ